MSGGGGGGGEGGGVIKGFFKVQKVSMFIQMSHNVF